MPHFRFLLAAGAAAGLLSACVPSPVVVDSPPDSCGASAWTDYVGLPQRALEGKSFGQPVRIIPADSAVTQDYSPARLNFDLDRSGTITRVWCG